MTIPTVVRRRMARRRLPMALAAGLMAAALAAGPVVAASQTQSATLTFSGSTNPNVTYTVTSACDDCVPDAPARVFRGGTGAYAFGATATTTVDHLDWTNSAAVAVNYDDALLRQGQTLGLSDVLTPAVGHIHATGSIGGSYGIYNDASGGTNFIPDGGQHSINKAATWDFNCAIPLPGESPRTCTSGSQSFDIDSLTLFVIPLPDPVSIDVDFSIAISLDLVISSSGVPTLRQIEVTGGNGPQTAPLTWLGSAPSTVADSQHFSCTDPAGNPVAYRFTNNAYAPTDMLASTTALVAKAVANPVLGPKVTLFSLGSFGSQTTSPADVSFPMNAPDASVTLGTLAKNNIPPVVNAGTSPYVGNEGTPIQFNGLLSSSVCGFPTLRWDFSDGGVAFGPQPFHPFKDDGTYSGLLTATDATGLTSSTTFSINVASLAPIVDAGPATTSAWGQPVAFNGSARAPGSDDQATLTYSWDFGDGTLPTAPSASGGATVFHSYTTPGVYTAVLTVANEDSQSSTSSRTVTIGKRTVTVGSLGDTAGTYDTLGALSASLVDQFGSTINGRTITFTVNGVAAGSAATNSSGIGSTAYTPLIDAGSYTTIATFAGDSLYLGSSGSGTIAISQKASKTTYTGALSGGPNKAITLSATLVDATGKALAGRTIVFKLGSQTTTAVTNASGVASTTLKLSQKNAKYALTATWTPVPADANHYLGSVASATFSLQAK